MPGYREFHSMFSEPRPNGSAALRRVLQQVESWLEESGIEYQAQTYRLYPYLFEVTGTWLIFSRSMLALAVWLRWGWITLPIAVIGLLGGFVDVALRRPLLAWVGAMQGKNLLLYFGPQQAEQEFLISAHTDSKTELLDHRQRMFFLRQLRLGIGLSLGLGLLGPLDTTLAALGSPWAPLTYPVGAVLAGYLLVLAWGLGLNLSAGRVGVRLGLVGPSSGAVDNGAACAILLGLAQRLQAGEVPLQRTRLTLALFSGEEVNMQGSRAFVRQRLVTGAGQRPLRVLNLEVMAQDGEYVVWERDGDVFRLRPTDAALNQLVSQAVQAVTGTVPRLAPLMNSDSGSFIEAGVPASVLGTYDQRWVDTGFHRPSDSPDRVVPERLAEGADILVEVLRRVDGC